MKLLGAEQQFSENHNPTLLTRPLGSLLVMGKHECRAAVVHSARQPGRHRPSPPAACYTSILSAGWIKLWGEANCLSISAAI